MPNIKKIILNPDKDGYSINEHYSFFTIQKRTSGDILNSKKELFLTYEGIIRLLYVSRSKNAANFRNWATEKLFTIQMGTVENKEILGTNILNVNIESFRAVFKSHASKFPCIYLLELGTVKNLRSIFDISLDINDNLIIYKYGFTDNMERRLFEHNNDYGKLKNININLATFHIIDVKYTSEAENDLRQFFKNMKKTLNIDGRKELIAIDKDELKTVIREYKHIGMDYIGATFELQNQIKDLEIKINNLYNEIKEINLKHELELIKKDMIIQDQMSLLKYKDLELENKDLKYANLLKQ